MDNPRRSQGRSSNKGRATDSPLSGGWFRFGASINKNRRLRRFYAMTPGLCQARRGLRKSPISGSFYFGVNARDARCAILSYALVLRAAILTAGLDTACLQAFLAPWRSRIALRERNAE